MARKAALTVAIIDDNRLVREALAAMLSTVTDLRVASSAVADAAFLEATQPDVLLLDAGLRDEDSLGVAAAVRAQSSATRIIVMDLVPVPEDIAEFVDVGVAGFVPKDATFEEFVSTIRAVAGGRTIFPAPSPPSLFAQIARDTAAQQAGLAEGDVRITPREREVIDLISEGLSNKEIATRLGIASHTVKSHVRNVMEKLALHTRLQIAAYSHQQDQH